ncbi:hypothetical protein D9M69_715490 [compost metagenome]
MGSACGWAADAGAFGAAAGGSGLPSAGGTTMAPASLPAPGKGAGLPPSTAFGFQPLLRSASAASCAGLRDTPRSTKGMGTLVT